jgi:hypothetical protein
MKYNQGLHRESSGTKMLVRGLARLPEWARSKSLVGAVVAAAHAYPLTISIEHVTHRSFAWVAGTSQGVGRAVRASPELATATARDP